MGALPPPPSPVIPRPLLPNAICGWIAKGEGRGTGELLLTLLTRRENRLDCQTRRSDGRTGGRGTTASLLSSLSLSSDMGPLRMGALSLSSTSPKIHPPSSAVAVSLPLVSFVRSPAESECGVADDNVPPPANLFSSDVHVYAKRERTIHSEVDGLA